MAKSPRNQVVALVTKHIDEFNDKQVEEILAFLQEKKAEEPKKAGTPMPAIVYEDEISKKPMFNISLSSNKTIDLTTMLQPGAVHYYLSGNRSGTALPNLQMGA